ncbi:hypothetical protein [Ornithinimicrobium kibberense]
MIHTFASAPRRTLPGTWVSVVRIWPPRGREPSVAACSRVMRTSSQ